MINISSSIESNSVTSGRVPPHNTEAEQSVLGSILLKEKAFTSVLDILSPADFYRKGHRIIFEAMIDLFQKNEPQDLVTITNLLNDKNHLEDVGGPTYLASLTSIVPVTANIVAYARIIRQKSILRNLISVNSDIANRCFEDQGDIDQLVDDAEQAIFDIAGKKSGYKFHSAQADHSRLFRNSRAALQTKRADYRSTDRLYKH